MQLPTINSATQPSNVTGQIPSSISSHIGFGANSGPISIINVENASNSNATSTAAKV